MAKNLNDLANDIAKMRKQLDRKVSTRSTSVAKHAIEFLINNTPVDTSKLVSNWIITFGSPKRGIIPAHAVGKKGSTSAISGSIAKNLAFSKLENRKPGTRIYITNNVPYLDEVNRYGGYILEAAMLYARNKP